MPLRRYWLQFEFSHDASPPAGVRMGCGVTAYDYDDAFALLREKVFRSAELPEVATAAEDVDISTLDARHVRPNMGDPTTRGVWFPMGYS